MILGFFCFLYFALLIIVIFKWNQESQIEKSNSVPGVSVIIPFRNEENNLTNTLACLVKQKSKVPFEIILINDHSTDNSLLVAKDFAARFPQIVVLNLIENNGKKSALALGISNANNDWILQTDADCEMSENWLQSMCNEISDNKVLLLGPVVAKDNNKKWDWFNQIECLVLQSITAVSAQFNQALLSNGANLLYKKTDYLAYVKSGLGQDFASGDDYFLMQFIQQNYKGGIKYVKNREAIVCTTFPSNWNDMIQQRSRWAKKSIGSSGISSFFLLLLVGIHFVFPFLIVASLFNISILHDAIPFFILKTSIEFILIYYVDQFFNTKKQNKILLFAIFYPLFLFQIVLSFRNKNNTWKERTI